MQRLLYTTPNWVLQSSILIHNNNAHDPIGGYPKINLQKQEILCYCTNNKI
jgi:hypothetical protein